MATCLVIGGGISGLSAAHYLTRAPKALVKKVVLIEATPYLGGWVATHRYDDGTMFEMGPRSLRPVGDSGQNTLEIVDELGLADEVVVVNKSDPAARNRYVYAKGQLNILPNSLASVFRRLPPFSQPLALSGIKEPFQKKCTQNDDSIYNFVSRRLGPEVAQYAVDPFCRGVFAGDARQLSVRSCLPPIWNYEQKSGSIFKGVLFGPKTRKPESTSQLVHKYQHEKWASFSLRSGLDKIPKMMTRSLQEAGVEIHTGAPCTSIELTGTKAKVKWKGGGIEADHVISSVLAQNLSPLVVSQHAPLAADLGRIPAVHVAVVCLEYEGNVLPVQGFGHLIPSSEPERVLGVVYESCVFPQYDRPGAVSTRLTCMMGGAWFQSLFGEPGDHDDQYFTDLAVEAVAKQLSVKTKPYRTKVFMQKNCIPQYQLGHAALLANIHSYIQQRHLPLSLVGSSYHGVSVNDCIYHSRLAVEALQAKLAT